MKILSIDWDYFFPDSAPYDWSAHEASPLYYELIWHHRVTSVNLITGESALDKYKPTIPDNFWDLITNKPKMIVAESHFQIWNYLHKGEEVVNIDAHHDCGYQEKDVVDCSNWGLWGKLTRRIGKFRQIYPSWRKDLRDGRKLINPTSVRYSLPKPNEYDLVFVCRSSCWTPPWYDVEFENFIRKPGLKFKKIDDMVKKCRGITLDQAKQERKTMLDAFEEMKAQMA